MNALAYDSVVEIINQANLRANINKIFVDTVGPEATYHRHLKSKVEKKEIEYTISKKADSKFITVGAASICAKVGDV